MSFKRFPANTSQRGENEVEIKLSSPATEQTVVRDNKEKGENIGCEDTYREYKSAVPPSNENEGQHDAEVRIISIPFSPPTPRKYLEEKKPSDRVGKYTIMRTIGHGNFAQVKLAVHENTFSEVAIKINDKKTLSEPCLIKLTREIRVLKTLTHPNIVRLYEVIETERHVYIVTEYARNGEIFEYLNKNGRMKEQEARPIFRQLLSAVEYCHQKHIVHRDLKTENLLLDDNNNLKLADFGFANTFDDSCTLNTFCGSPPYAAPELLNGQTYHGPEVDVWSMGVILYMLVCNELPFDGYTLKELRARVMRGRYKIPFYLSHSLEALLKKMLIIKPEKRATIPALMSDTWVNLGFENDPLRPYVEPPLHYDDVVRTALMSQMGFKREEIEDAFENKRFNDVTATYLLLGSAEARQKVRRHLQAQEINNNKSRNILERANSVIMVGGRNRPNSPGRQDTGEDAGKFRPRNLGEWVTTSLRISDPRGKPSASIEQNKEVCGPQTNLHQIGNGPRKPNEILIIERDSPKPDLQTRDRTSAARNRLPSDNSPLVQDPSVPRPRTRSTRRTPSNGKYGTGKPPCFDSDNKRSQSPGYQDESKRELMFQPSIGKGMQMKRTNHQLPDVVQPARRMTRGNVIIVSDITQNKAEQDNTSPKHMTDQRGETRRRPERRKVSALKVTIPDAGDNRSDSETIDSPTELDVSKRWPRTIYASSRAARREEPEDEALNRFFFSPPIQRKEYNIYPRHPGLDTLHTSPEEKQSREEREKHWKKYEGTTFVVDDDSLGNPRLNSATRANEHIIRLDDRHKIHPTVEISRSPDSPEQVNPPVTVSKPLKGRTTFEPDLTKVPEMPNNVENKPQDRTASPRVQSPTSGLLPRVYTIVVPKRNLASDEGGGSDKLAASNKNSADSVHLSDRTTDHSTERRVQNPANRVSSIFSNVRQIFGTEMKFADRRRGHSSAEHSMPTLQKAERTQGRDHSRGREHSLFRRYAADRNRSTSRIRWTVNAKLRASDISIDQPHYDVQTPTSPTEPSHTVYVRPKIPQEKNVTVIEVNSKWKYGPNEGNSQDNVDSPVLERTETTDVSVSEGLPTEEPSAAAAPPTYSRVQPRRQNWPFGVNVRGQNPEVLMLAATKILADMNITYDYVTPYRLICTQQPPASTGSYGANNKKQQPVKWETEVVQLTRAKQYGVRMKYASGDTTKYRMLEKTIMNQFPKAT